MPPPSRQEFDAASKRVLANAPAGLSREQFFDLIDKEIQAGDPSTWTSDGGKVVYDSPGGAQAAKLESGEIPSTWIGGFLKSIKDQVMTPDLKHALGRSAQPETVGDMLGILLPNTIGRSANLGIEMEKAGQASSRAAKGTGVLNRVRSYWKGVGQDIDTPTQVLGSGPHEPIYARDQELLGLKPETTPRPPTSSVMPPAAKGDLYEMYAGKGSPSPTAGPRAAAPEPIFYKGQRIDPNDKLFKKLMEADIPENQMGPVDRPKVPTGFQDRGPVADQLRNEAFDRVANRQGMSQNTVGQTPASEPSPRMQPQPEAPAAAPEMRPVQAEPDPLARELLGPTSKVNVTSLKPDAIQPEEWAGLRRHYGTKRLSELTGVPEDIIEEMAPGPSRTPIEVEDRLNQNPLGVMKYLP